VRKTGLYLNCAYLCRFTTALLNTFALLCSSRGVEPSKHEMNGEELRKIFIDEG